MSFPFYIAKRYIFSKKKVAAINIISIISIVGVAVGSMAMLVVLAALNGLGSLVESLYSSFDPDIKIETTIGKTFTIEDTQLASIQQIDGVQYVIKTIEETCYLKYGDKESVATIKGVESDFVQMTGIDSMVVEGKMLLQNENYEYAIMGYGIAYSLSLYIDESLQYLSVYAAKRDGKYRASNPDDAFKISTIIPSGIFAINQDFDMKYLVTSYDFAKDLLEYEDEITALEIGLEPNADEKKVKEQLHQLLSDDFKIRTRYELNELIFKTNKTEKWISFLILAFILTIATFNLVGSITMLILDKKDDIAILKSMGANLKMIKRIFFFEGFLITIIGCLIGLLLGAILCILQQQIGLVPLQGVIVEYYPVKLIFSDFIVIVLTVLGIGTIASYFPVKFLAGRYYRAK
ncbi:MAG: FtsX-like permease family protein [Flavobacteriales bacterium]|nr:FtsX-like permease family protein [Flavobacteriales bacterium]